MKKMKNKEKYVMTIRLLEDPNGKKMGKTEGNIVSLNEKPSEMFGQIMAWPDGLIIPGLELCTDIPMEEIKQIEQDIKADKLNPRDAKARLAKEIISIHHNSQDAGQAEKEFEKVFKDKDKPSQIPICKLSNKKYNILDLLVEIKLASSKGEAKRLIGQGGVKIDDQKINDWQKEIIIKDGMIIQAGKRKFIRVKI